MRIDINSETLVAFCDAKELPSMPSSRNLYLWSEQGRRAMDGKLVFLDYVKIGGRRFTSREAFTRFSEQLTAARDEQ